MIRINNLKKQYGDRIAVDIPELEIEQGEHIILTGHNGSGKSTLLKSIVRIAPHSSGEILVGGMPVEKMSTRKLAQNVAYLAQNKKAPDISVIKMVLHGRFAYLNYPRKYRPQDYEIAKDALEWAGMSERSHEIVSKLSGGMQQKVYIAMALAQDADTILMDEPTTYLDIVHQLRLMEMARQLAKEGKAVVMVLHDLTQALRIADKVLVLKEGKIIAQGTADEVYESGSLQKAFGVEIEKIETKKGEIIWHYSRFL